MQNGGEKKVLKDLPDPDLHNGLASQVSDGGTRLLPLVAFYSVGKQPG